MRRLAAIAEQAGAMVTFDFVAEGRADRYTERIEALTPRVRPILTPTAIGLGGTF